MYCFIIQNIKFNLIVSIASFIVSLPIYIYRRIYFLTSLNLTYQARSAPIKYWIQQYLYLDWINDSHSNGVNILLWTRWNKFCQRQGLRFQWYRIRHTCIILNVHTCTSLWSKLFSLFNLTKLKGLQIEL